MTDESTSEIRLSRTDTHITADCPFCEREETFDNRTVGRAWLTGHIQAEHSAQLPSYENGRVSEGDDTDRGLSPDARRELRDTYSERKPAGVTVHLVRELPWDDEVELGDWDDDTADQGTDDEDDELGQEIQMYLRGLPTPTHIHD